MNYLIKIILVIVSLTFSLKAKETIINNKILFTINNDVYTNYDFEQRLKYVGIINNIKISNLDQKSINNIYLDYISILIFNEYKIKNNIRYDSLFDEVESAYNNNFKDKLITLNFKEEEISLIKKHLKMDLTRKKMTEDFLNFKKNILSKKTNELDLIYNYNLNSITIKNYEVNQFDLKKLINRNNFLDFKSYLVEKKIKFLFTNKDIIDSSKISEFISDNINSNKKIFTLMDEKFITLFSLEINLESYDGVFVKIYNIKSKKKIDGRNLNCEYINNNNNNNNNIITFKEYEYSKLNNKIKDNLKSINDYIFSLDNDIYNYLFLCSLRFNEDLLNTINFNKKVNNLASDIQLKFINKYKKEYNFTEVNE